MISVKIFLESICAKGISPTEEGYKCCCPFPDHNDETPSFFINKKTGLWKCYGCEKEGNLDQLTEQLGFSIIVKTDDENWPNELPDFCNKVESKEEVLSEDRVLLYKKLCPAYMLNRGFSKTFLKKFEIGFDPDTFRVVFPIRSVDKKLVGITRRAIVPSDIPKYKHTKFNKNKYLYLGQYIIDADRFYKGFLFITEGHVDALRLWSLRDNGKFYKEINSHKAIFCGAVATMGGSVSKEQIKTCFRPFMDIVLAFDNDDAGKKFKTKAFEMFTSNGARNIYELIYPGKDPGDLDRKSKVEIKLMEECL
jgi:DNA primase